MLVALYARVSTGDQDPESQLVALRRYCEARGWKIFAEYVDTASGAVASRPRLDQMMKDAKANKFGAVLVWKFDRLFRSVPDMLASLEIFRILGVEFVSMTECLDTTTSVGKFVYTLLAAVGDFERDLIRERTAIGMARARAEGKRIGRPRVLVDHQEVLRLWEGGKGMSIRAISRQLGVKPTKIHEIIHLPVQKLG